VLLFVRPSTLKAPVVPRPPHVLVRRRLAIREAMKVCDEADDMIAAGVVGDMLRCR
jgi:hypothetical protein